MPKVTAQPTTTTNAQQTSTKQLRTENPKQNEEDASTRTSNELWHSREQMQTQRQTHTVNA